MREEQKASIHPDAPTVAVPGSEDGALLHLSFCTTVETLSPAFQLLFAPPLVLLRSVSAPRRRSAGRQIDLLLTNRIVRGRNGASGYDSLSFPISIPRIHPPPTGSPGCDLTVYESPVFWTDSSSTFGSGGLSFQRYSRPYIGIICTRLSRAQGTNPSSMSVSEFEEGGGGGGTFSVSVFSFPFTGFLLPL